MSKNLTAWALCAFLVAVCHAAPSAAGPLMHQDVEEVTITEGLAGTWTATSLLQFTSDHPHETPVGGVVQFISTNIWTGSATWYHPLFVPGERLGGAPPGAGDDIDGSGVYETDWVLTGPAIFDYTLPWTLRVEPNRPGFEVAEVTFQASIAPTLTVGGAEVSLGGFGVNVTLKPTGATANAFESIGLAKEFQILTDPRSDGTGFFRSGGRIVLRGWIKDTALGKSTLLYDNPHLLSGEGVFLDDFIRANAPGMLRTEVFDENTSVPEPMTLSLLALGGLALLRRKQ